MPEVQINEEYRPIGLTAVTVSEVGWKVGSRMLLLCIPHLRFPVLRAIVR